MVERNNVQQVGIDKYYNPTMYMENSVNIFYKIFQIMDYYETALDNYTIKGNKYKPDETFNAFMNADEFFSFISKEVPVNKRPQPPNRGEPPIPDEDIPTPPVDETPPIPDEDIPAPPVDETPPTPDDKPHNDPDAIINAYIKKCYKVIVLKCHPDKNKLQTNIHANFIKCQEYYDENLLIGLLYIFYIYKLSPPSPLNISTPVVPNDKCNIIIDRIFREIRVIQCKLESFNLPMPETEQQNETPYTGTETDVQSS